MAELFLIGKSEDEMTTFGAQNILELEMRYDKINVTATMQTTPGK